MKSIRQLLVVITTGCAIAEPKPAEGCVFYGMLLKPTSKGTEPQWQPNGPNFSIVEPGSTVPRKGMVVVCLRTMNMRSTCLKVDFGAAPGTYHWGEATGQKVKPGEKVKIRCVTKLPSKMWEYYWSEVEPVH